MDAGVLLGGAIAVPAISFYVNQKQKEIEGLKWRVAQSNGEKTALRKVIKHMQEVNLTRLLDQFMARLNEDRTETTRSVDDLVMQMTEIVRSQSDMTRTIDHLSEKMNDMQNNGVPRELLDKKFDELPAMITSYQQFVAAGVDWATRFKGLADQEATGKLDQNKLEQAQKGSLETIKTMTAELEGLRHRLIDATSAQSLAQKKLAEALRAKAEAEHTATTALETHAAAEKDLKAANDALEGTRQQLQSVQKDLTDTRQELTSMTTLRDQADHRVAEERGQSKSIQQELRQKNEALVSGMKDFKVRITEIEEGHRQEMGDCKRQVEAAEVKERDATTHLESVTANLNNSKSRLSTETQLRTIREEFQSSKASLLTAQNDLAASESKCSQLTEDLRSLKEKVASPEVLTEFESKLNSAIKERDALDKARKSLDHKANDAERRLKNVQSALTTKAGEYKSQATKLGIAEENRSTCQRQLKSTKELLSAKEDELKAKNEEQAKLRKDLQESRESNRLLKQGSETSAEKIRILAKKEEDTRKELETLNAKSDSSADELRAQLDQVKGQLHEKVLSIETAQNRVIDLEKLRTKEEEETTHLKGDVESRKGEIEAIQNEKEVLQTKANDGEEKVVELQKGLAQSQQLLRTSSSEHKTSRVQLEAQKGQAEKAEAKAQEARANLDACEAQRRELHELLDTNLEKSLFEDSEVQAELEATKLELKKLQQKSISLVASYHYLENAAASKDTVISDLRKLLDESQKRVNDASELRSELEIIKQQKESLSQELMEAKSAVQAAQQASNDQGDSEILRLKSELETAKKKSRTNIKTSQQELAGLKKSEQSLRSQLEAVQQELSEEKAALQEKQDAIDAQHRKDMADFEAQIENDKAQYEGLIRELRSAMKSAEAARAQLDEEKKGKEMAQKAWQSAKTQKESIQKALDTAQEEQKSSPQNPLELQKKVNDHEAQNNADKAASENALKEKEAQIKDLLEENGALLFEKEYGSDEEEEEIQIPSGWDKKVWLEYCNRMYAGLLQSQLELSANTDGEHSRLDPGAASFDPSAISSQAAAQRATDVPTTPSSTPLAETEQSAVAAKTEANEAKASTKSAVEEPETSNVANGKAEPIKATAKERVETAAPASPSRDETIEKPQESQVGVDAKEDQPSTKQGGSHIAVDPGKDEASENLGQSEVVASPQKDKAIDKPEDSQVVAVDASPQKPQDVRKQGETKSKGVASFGGGPKGDAPAAETLKQCAHFTKCGFSATDEDAFRAHINVCNEENGKTRDYSCKNRNCKYTGSDYEEFRGHTKVCNFEKTHKKNLSEFAPNGRPFRFVCDNCKMKYCDNEEDLYQDHVDRCADTEKMFKEWAAEHFDEYGLSKDRPKLGGYNSNQVKAKAVEQKHEGAKESCRTCGQSFAKKNQAIYAHIKMCGSTCKHCKEQFESQNEDFWSHVKVCNPSASVGASSLGSFATSNAPAPAAESSQNQPQTPDSNTPSTSLGTSRFASSNTRANANGTTNVSTPQAQPSRPATTLSATTAVTPAAISAVSLEATLAAPLAVPPVVTPGTTGGLGDIGGIFYQSTSGNANSSTSQTPITGSATPASVTPRSGLGNSRFAQDNAQTPQQNAALDTPAPIFNLITSGRHGKRERNGSRGNHWGGRGRGRGTGSGIFGNRSRRQ